MTTIIHQVPGDKSISHRAIICAALASGETIFDGFLLSEDCLNTMRVFQDLGVDIQRIGTRVIVNSGGISSFQAPRHPLYVGNSGTGIRLITGVLCALPFNTDISGDDSIQQRPMARIIDPLTKMGADVSSCDGLPPLHIRGGQSLQGIDYAMPIASAQVKSAVLVAGCASGVPVTVREPEQCRDHTERMFQLFGAPCTIANGVVTYDGSPLIPPSSVVQIPADISSALFLIVLALIKNEPITLTNIGLNPSRTGCLEVLKMMHAPIEFRPHHGAYEPMGDIIVHASAHKMVNINVPDRLVPNIIDECPILAVLAACTTGVFTVRHAAELRVKESDRIDGICRLIRGLGGHIIAFDDGFSIDGRCIPSSKNPFTYDPSYDHRLAMAAIIASRGLGIDIAVLDDACIRTSFPTFFDLI